MGKAPAYQELPKRYLQEGLITSNTYQVHLDVIADSKNEAIRIGKEKARTKTYNMILNEPSLNFQIGSYGRSQIKDLIQRKGDVVYITPASEDTWQIVFQVYQKGLWDYLRKLY